MRYYINFSKTLNQLVPHYIGGRKLILLLQAVLMPLQILANSFRDWAKETRIEAAMTSQVFKFEWFLNRRFSKYFLNPADRISVVTSIEYGIAFYYESAHLIDPSDNATFYKESEGQDNSPFYLQNEQATDNQYSFVVHSPAIDTTKISQTEYVAMVAHQVDKYKLSNKTYNIIFEA